MKNNPILHTLLALAIFAAGAGFASGIASIHERNIKSRPDTEKAFMRLYPVKHDRSKWVEIEMRNACLDCHDGCK